MACGAEDCAVKLLQEVAIVFRCLSRSFNSFSKESAVRASCPDTSAARETRNAAAVPACKFWRSTMDMSSNALAFRGR